MQATSEDFCDLEDADASWGEPGEAFSVDGGAEAAEHVAGYAHADGSEGAAESPRFMGEAEEGGVAQAVQGGEAEEGLPLPCSETEGVSAAAVTNAEAMEQEEQRDEGTGACL